MFYQHELSM
jgi:hypothetical protein